MGGAPFIFYIRLVFYYGNMSLLFGEIFGLVSLVLILGLRLLCSQGAELLEPPQSKTVPFNETATFVCLGNGSTLVWRIDGTILHSSDQEKGVTFTDSGGGSNVPGLLSSMLTINVTELPFSSNVISQGIKISCQIVSQNPFDEVFSNTAILSVTGISPPQNISLSGDWTLTWSDQFYRPRDALLDDQTFDVILNGEVIIANTTKTSIQLNPFCNKPTSVIITAYIGPYHSSTSVLFENVIDESIHNDVIDIEVNENEDGSISIQCVYSKLSSADGCHVTFTHATTGYNESFNITGSDITIISLSTSGVYNVTAYDISNDGSIVPWTCVQTKQVNVTIITIATTSSNASTVSSTYSSNGTPVITTLSPSVPVETENTQEVGSPSPTPTFSSNKPTGTTSNTGAYIGGTSAAVVFIIIVIISLVVIYCKLKRKKTNEEPEVRPEAEEESVSELEERALQKRPFSFQEELYQEHSAMRTETDFNGTARDPYVSADSARPVANKDPVLHNNYDNAPGTDNFMETPSSPSCDKGTCTFVPTHQPNLIEVVNDGTRSTIENVDPQAQLKDVKESPD